MRVAELPPLPPLPKREDSRVVSGETVRTKTARLMARWSLVAHETAPNLDTGERRVVFACAGCGTETPWWSSDNEKRSGPTWGRWETGDTRAVFVQDKATKKLRRVVVPVTVAGRVCGKCSRELAGFRRTQEPAVTELPKGEGE